MPRHGCRRAEHSDEIRSKFNRETTPQRTARSALLILFLVLFGAVQASRQPSFRSRELLRPTATATLGINVRVIKRGVSH